MELLDILKHSLYIDGDYEDDYLNYLISVAKDTIMRGLDHTVEPVSPTFTHAVVLLASHYYENRIQGTDAQLHSLPFGVHSLVLQLRGEYYEGI